MFYVFDYTITTSDVEATPKELDLHLTAGVIHQVDILFQDGCDHLVNVQIFQANHQLWPTNSGKALRGNATVISFREFQELQAGGAMLTALIWGDGTVEDVEVIIEIGLLPKRVIQPLSFDELLRAAAGVE